MKKQPKILIEACVNSVESCLAAQAGGADRVELCDNLYEGGTTPSAGILTVARDKLHMDIQAMIRPRGGDFCYSDVEFAVMKQDIRFAKELGANGVVFGILQPDGNIDQDRTRELIDLARPLNVTFHRAFDMTSDPFRACDDLIALGVDRILTSGQENKAIEGVNRIAELVKYVGNQIIILVGSGVNEQNISELRQKTGAQEFHVSVRKETESRMHFRNPKIFMGGIPGIPEYMIPVTDAERIRKIVQQVKIGY